MLSRIKIISLSLLLTGLVTSTSIWSIELVYRQPVAPVFTATDKAMSCDQLEQEISRLQPLTYSYKPGFYEDPWNSAIITVGTTMYPWAYGLFGYGATVDYQEAIRIRGGENRIELLRLLKAEKHCYENL
ncbi:MAG: hypothetical protein GY934_08540 [Gammaproteobacteria bacterium]|nr:hypothetical protein [Gammaproteobacteria bacterium]